MALIACLTGCSTVVGLGDVQRAEHPTDGSTDLAGDAVGTLTDGFALPVDGSDPDVFRSPDPDDGILPPDVAVLLPVDMFVGPPPDGCAPTGEVCNGEDDDCDGLTDERIAAPFCENQVGVCAGATPVCGGANGWRPCDDRRYNQNDPGWTPVENAIHCDGRDNDCDGEADEGCECRPDDTQDCGVDVGECQAGLQRCDNGTFGDCSGRGPERETCDGRDEDCDGQADEGAECGRDEECIEGECERVRWVFQAEGAGFGHTIGRRDGDGWSANTGDDDEGFLCFGPYTRDIPAGRFDARIRLMVDNIVANNDTVVRIEVNDFDRRPDCGDCVIAQRVVRRREFAQSRQYQDFTLRFDNPGGRRLEFRTFWTDRAYVREDRVEVVRAP